MKKIPTPNYETIKAIIPMLDDDLTKYLTAFAYAGCARIGEITRPDIWHAPKRAQESSIMESDIYTKIEPTGKRIYLRIKTTKTKSSLTERNVPLNPEKESWLCNLLQKYIQEYNSILNEIQLKDYHQGELFPFRPSWAYRKIIKYLGFNPHILRHARATHYLRGDITGRPMTLEFVAKIGGWSNLSTLSKRYSGVIMDDVSASL